MESAGHATPADGHALERVPCNGSHCSKEGERGVVSTHGSSLIRRQRGHPGVVLPLVIYDSAKQ